MSAESNSARTVYTLFIYVENSPTDIVEVLKFVDDGTYIFNGIYIVEGSSSQYVSLSNESFSGTGEIRSYSMWGATEHKTGLIKTVGKTHDILGDTRIMLSFSRKPVTITVDEKIWDTNYNASSGGKYFYEELNTNWVFNKKSTTVTTYILPSGLVGVVPAYYHPVNVHDRNDAEVFYQNTDYS